MNRDWSRLAPLPIRLMFGIAFMVHGFPNLFDVQTHAGLVERLAGIGVPVPVIIAWWVGLVDFVGGLALVLGAFTRIIACLFIPSLLLSLFGFHWQQGFGYINVIGMGPGGPVFGMPGYEVPLMYIAGVLALAIGGAGAFSVDDALRRRPLPADSLHKAPI